MISLSNVTVVFLYKDRTHDLTVALSHIPGLNHNFEIQKEVKEQKLTESETIRSVGK